VNWREYVRPPSTSGCLSFLLSPFYPFIFISSWFFTCLLGLFLFVPQPHAISSSSEHLLFYGFAQFLLFHFPLQPKSHQPNHNVGQPAVRLGSPLTYTITFSIAFSGHPFRQPGDHSDFHQISLTSRKRSSADMERLRKATPRC
jgi:hypothetical protein